MIGTAVPGQRRDKLTTEQPNHTVKNTAVVTMDDIMRMREMCGVSSQEAEQEQRAKEKKEL